MKNLILFILFLITFNSYSQTDKSQYYDTGSHFNYDIFYRPGEIPDSSDITIVFRISWNQLKFIRNKENNANIDEFVTKYSVESEFRDTSGIIRKRINLQNSLLTTDFLAINQKDKYIYHIVNLRLLNGTYSSVFRIYDADKTKLAEVKPKDINLKSENSMGIFSSAVFAFQNSANKFNQFVLNKNAGFSSNDIKVLLQVKNSRSKLYYYTFEYLDTNNTPVVLSENETTVGTAELLPGKKIEQKVHDCTSVQVDLLASAENGNGNDGILIFTFPADRTVPSKCRLLLWDGKSSDTLKYEFFVLWDNQPVSLQNPARALDIMYYILKDSEYEQMNSGNNKDKLRRIFQWWKSKDPTKFSIYNEAMTEYFNRADYSTKNFKTNSEKDGAFTDRGKIFILNGKPDTTDTNMQLSGQNVEIWTYKKLNKQFVFQTDKNGIIYLKEIKQI